MDDLDLLVCIVCVARVDATSDEAEGWVRVHHSVDQGDDHDDPQWFCPEHAPGDDGGGDDDGPTDPDPACDPARPVPVGA